MYQYNKFIKNSFFHICNKSISNFGIFKDQKNAFRFLKSLYYLNTSENKSSLSKHLRNIKNKTENFNSLIPHNNNLVKILAYCIMPDHYHLLVKILNDYVLSKYIGDLENSFTRFFNIKFKRKGPLWQSRFRSVEIKTNEQLLQVSRYIHLNPTTARLVEKPEDWKFSSYRDYLNNDKILKEIMTEITIKNPKTYKKFCDDRIDYQRKLKEIKKLLLE